MPEYVHLFYDGLSNDDVTVIIPKLKHKGESRYDYTLRDGTFAVIVLYRLNDEGSYHDMIQCWNNIDYGTIDDAFGFGVTKLCVGVGNLNDTNEDVFKGDISVLNEDIKYYTFTMENIGELSDTINELWDNYVNPLSHSMKKSDTGKHLSECSNIVYDIITVFISIADFVTDIWMLIQYRNTGQNVFFGIGLFIIICAQISYSIAFNWRYSKYDWCGSIVLLVAVLPIAPILGIVFYLGNDKNSWFSKKIMEGIFGLTPDTRSPDANESALMKWVNDKLYKHVGFILESLLEAFPNAVLVYDIILYLIYVYCVFNIETFICTANDSHCGQ